MTKRNVNRYGEQRTLQGFFLDKSVRGTNRDFLNFRGGGGGASVSSITNQPKEDMNEQLKELSTNSMLEMMCPSLKPRKKLV